MNILVLCTGNSARSVLLESLLTAHGAHRGIRAWSAGSRPAGKVHPMTLQLLAEKGLPAEGLRSKGWDEFAAPGAPVMDLVVTVCSSAAGETCPLWPGAPLRAHWGVEDPAAAPADRQHEAFATAFDRLETRARAFCALDPARLSRPELAAELDRIGSL